MLVAAEKECRHEDRRRPSCLPRAPPLPAQAQRLPRPWLLVLEGAYTSWLQQRDTFLAVLDAFLDQDSKTKP